ncbi:MAG: hypothetical protein JWO45_695 [Spartobacteria bacterium]|nr:hypothetical protein [Spartobacteria bacterium]
MNDEFGRFEHEGWERVAEKYDSVWSSSTRQFIPFLLDAAEVDKGMALLDIGCGPGYVSIAAAERAAVPIGLDFSGGMLAIARAKSPRIEFREGDAQQLPFENASFDRVVANFSLLHVSDPERAIGEAFRVLKPGGKFAFTVWAPPSENPYAKMVDDALDAHADLTVKIPSGPPHYLFSGKEEFRSAIERAGFDGATMIFELHMIEWSVPTARHAFDAELTAGVRTAGLLARQTQERLEKIRGAIETEVRCYARGERFAIPKSAYVVAVGKSKS